MKFPKVNKETGSNEKKKVLQEKFIQQVKTVTKKEILNIDDKKQSNKKWHKKLHKQIKELTNTNIQLKKECLNLKKSRDEKAHKHYEATQINTSLMQELKSINKLLEEANKERTELRNNIGQLEKELESSKEIIKNQVQKLSSYLGQIKMFEEQAQLSKKAAQIKTLEDTVAKMHKEIARLQQELFEIGSQSNADIINVFMNQINSFTENEHNQLLTLVDRINNFLKTDVKKNSIKNNKSSTSIVQVKSEVGVAKIKDDQWIFVNLNGDEFELETYGEIALPDTPIRADTVKNKAYLMYVYKQSQHTYQKILGQKEQNGRILEETEKAEEEIFERIYLNGVKTLIVTGRLNRNYRKRLSLYGVEVETHNPFEESYEVLSGKMQRADIIIVITTFVSHSVLNHIDINSDRVELMERDSIHAILSRIRYLTIKLGLI
jgi:hypothetical protein